MRKAIALVTALSLSACANIPKMQPRSQYVAMGSSYAAGTSIEGNKPGTPARCGRSPRNYASQVASWLSLDLIDVTCGGATTANILGKWAELPPQIDGVTPQTRLVTITIGGNDVGYVRNLMIGACPLTSKQCPPLPVVTEEDWSKLGIAMHTIVRQIRARSPDARIVFVDYVRLIPEKTTCPAIAITPEAVVDSRKTWNRLAEITANVAKTEKVGLLAAGKLSGNHTPCDKDPWSVAAPGSAPGVPWHPNAAGHDAIAQALVRMLTN